jgi:hypothetical protein
MTYYVVNARNGRSTHIMDSLDNRIPGLGTFIASNVIGFGGGTEKYTLCGSYSAWVGLPCADGRGMARWR